MYSDNNRIREDVLQRTDHISGTFEKAIVEFKDKVETEIAEKQRRMDANDTLYERDKMFTRFMFGVGSLSCAEILRFVFFVALC